MFHKISQFHPGYSYEASDTMYSLALNRNYTKAITVLFDIAEKYGIT